MLHLIYLRVNNTKKALEIREHCVIHFYVQPSGPFDTSIFYPLFGLSITCLLVIKIFENHQIKLITIFRL